LDSEKIDNMAPPCANGAAGAEAEKSSILVNVMFFRALDNVSFGTILLVFLLCFKGMLDVLPIPFIQYSYIIPIYMIFSGVMHFPEKGFQLFQYRKSLFRLVWGTIFMLLLSPFLQWWSIDTNSPYLLFNFLLFCISVVFFIISLSNLFNAVAREEGIRWVSRISRLTRFTALYLMMAPLLAFFVTVLLGKCVGQDIFLFVVRLEKWKLIVFLVPVFLTLMMLIQLRYAKYRNLK